MKTILRASMLITITINEKETQNIFVITYLPSIVTLSNKIRYVRKYDVAIILSMYFQILNNV